MLFLGHILSTNRKHPLDLVGLVTNGLFMKRVLFLFRFANIVNDYIFLPILFVKYALRIAATQNPPTTQKATECTPLNSC